MPITFDPSDIPDTDGPSFDPLPIGEYQFTISAAEEKVSSNGNDMIVLTLDIDRPEGGIAKVWTNLTFTPKAMGIVKSACDAMGLGDKVRSGELSAEDFLGAMGRCKLKHEEYQGVVRERVHYFIPGGKPAAKPVVDEIKDEDIPF